MSKKIALVTGASGFIGSRLIQELAEHGFEVRALMRKTSSDSRLKGLKFTRILGDLSDLRSLHEAVIGVSHIFHLAGAITALNREGFFKHNSQGTANLAQAAAEMEPGQIQKFVFISSLAAGGPMNHRELRTEEHPDQPVSAYGESKLAGEKELLQYRDRLPISIIRPPLVYGPGDQATFIFVQTVARGLFPSFGEKHYSTIHVADLCRGIVRSSESVTESGQIFYLSSNDTITYDQLMLTIARDLGKRPVRIPVPRVVLRAAAHGFTLLGRWSKRTFALNRDKLCEIEPDYWICSNEKAKRVLGFDPVFEFQEGMSDAIRWYRSERWI